MFTRPSHTYILPGFRLTLLFTVFYLTLIVLLPLSGLIFKTATLTFAQFIAIVTDGRLKHAYLISFGISFLASLVNLAGGLLVAWVLVRYEFPAKN